MCYDVKYLTQKKLNYAKRMGETPDEIRKIENDLNQLTQHLNPQFHASAFSHPGLLVFKSEALKKPWLLSWGLIPFWVKSDRQASKIRNNTINARIETMFEKPSFKSSAIKRRCLVMLDGFYEHHYFNGKTYPFYIYNMKNNPLVVAGLWDQWKAENEQIYETVTIVTRKAIGIMKKIHNNPRLMEARMPLVLSETGTQLWTSDSIDQSTLLKSVCQEVVELQAHSVRVLKGKNALGNVPEVSSFFGYSELRHLEFVKKR